jgi:ketosteroid isomerase-like protein
VRNNIYVNFLQKSFSERRLEGSNVAVRVSGNTAWLVYDWTFTAKTADGQVVNSKGWESQLYQRTRQGWTIVGLHYSAQLPPPPR